jgi:hypothetical protein
MPGYCLVELVAAAASFWGFAVTAAAAATAGLAAAADGVVGAASDATTLGFACVSTVDGVSAVSGVVLAAALPHSSSAANSAVERRSMLMLTPAGE